jgi:putative membrane protein
VSRAERLALVALIAIALITSVAIASDRFTWLLEVVPVLIGVPVLIVSARRFPLTPLLYRLLFLHALVLILGGAYTYAKVPLGFWLQDLLHLERNPYDRIGHLIQGFVPAILAREILLRTSPLRPGRWLFVLVASVCLAFSAFYELIEWWVAAATGAGAEAFLGTQGDVWDTQWDMFCALIGAVSAQLMLASFHDQQLASPPVNIAPTATGPHSAAR